MNEKTATRTNVVTAGMAAAQMGSGTLSVLATPALIAMMENTAMAAIGPLPDGQTTVGVSMDMRHVRASAVGETIVCEATLTAADGRKYTLDITARDSGGNLVGTARHERFLVDAERFMKKLSRTDLDG